MRDAIETVLFWAAALTGSSVLLLVFCVAIEKCVRTSLRYMGLYHDFIAFMIKRRRAGRT